MSDEEFNKKMDALFEKYDADKDGALNANEVRELLKDKFSGDGKVDAGRVEQFIKACDSNDDGKIQKGEIVKVYKKLLQL